MARTKWVKRRHRAIFAFLRVIFRWHTKLKYNFTAIKTNITGPAIVMCNHATTLDPFFVSLSFKRPVYFYASDDLFNIKFVSPIIRYLAAPIPKSKSVKDLQAVRDSLTVLKEGGIVGLFPEGNRTYSGGQWEITDAAAKLAKLCKAPLILYNIQGGYGSDPRWGKKTRKGKMLGYVKRVLSAEELKSLSVPELFEIIKTELNVDDTLSGVKFKSRRRAENIERVLYMCPKCGAVSAIQSHKSRFKCRNCGAEWTYNEDLSISPSENFSRVYEWHEWEKSELKKRAERNEIRFEDRDIKFFKSVRLKRKERLDGRSIAADASGITVIGKKSAFYPFSQMTALTVVGKRKFNFYVDGEILQIKGGKRFCALKYLHLFEVSNDV